MRLFWDYKDYAISNKWWVNSWRWEGKQIEENEFRRSLAFWDKNTVQATIPRIYGLVTYKVPYDHDSKMYKVC